MATAVDICNSALIKLGCDPINSLTEDNIRAKICNARYSILRDEMLRAHPWKFARKRITLSPTVDAPAFEYESAFQLPSDCLRPFIVNKNRCDWIQEGPYVLSNESEIEMVYIARVSESQFDSSFVEVLALRIAMDICYKITQSNPRAQEVKAEYLVMLADARSFSAQSGRQENYLTSDEYVNVRY